MNVTWLQDFLALAASGNFSRAAEERHSSQPAFSRRIRGLEEWLGAALVDRSTQPARLTEAGEWFRGIAEELLARIERLPGEARSVAEAGAVTLRIAATHALSFTFLPGWLRGIEAAGALGPIQLSSDVAERCEALLQQGRVDVVLSHAHAAIPGLLDIGCVALQVGEDRLIPLARPDAQGRPSHSLEDGDAAQVLSYSDASGLGRILRQLLGRRLDGLGARSLMSAHLASVLRTMALDGRGLAWLPRGLVEDDLAQGRLVPAGGVEWQVPLEIRLYRRREIGNAAVEAFWRASSRTAPAEAERQLP